MLASAFATRLGFDERVILVPCAHHWAESWRNLAHGSSHQSWSHSIRRWCQRLPRNTFGIDISTYITNNVEYVKQIHADCYPLAIGTLDTIHGMRQTIFVSQRNPELFVKYTHGNASLRYHQARAYLLIFITIEVFSCIVRAQYNTYHFELLQGIGVLRVHNISHMLKQLSCREKFSFHFVVWTCLSQQSSQKFLSSSKSKTRFRWQARATNKVRKLGFCNIMCNNLILWWYHNCYSGTKHHVAMSRYLYRVPGNNCTVKKSAWKHTSLNRTTAYSIV